MSEGTLSISRCVSHGMWDEQTKETRRLSFDLVVEDMKEQIKNTPNWENAGRIVMVFEKIQSPPGLGPTGSTMKYERPADQELSSSGCPDAEARMRMWRESGPK